MVLYGELMRGIQFGDIISDFKFTIYEIDADGNITEMKYIALRL